MADNGAIDEPSSHEWNRSSSLDLVRYHLIKVLGIIATIFKDFNSQRSKL